VAAARGLVSLCREPAARLIWTLNKKTPQPDNRLRRMGGFLLKAAFAAEGP